MLYCKHRNFSNRYTRAMAFRSPTRRKMTEMPNQIIIRKRDFDNDVQQASIPVALALTPASGGTSDIIAATNFWLGGAEGGIYHKTEINADAGAAAGSPVDQGALQLMIEMVDDVTGRVYTERLPIPDLAKAADVGTNPAWVVSGGLTVMNPEHADYATFKTAWEAGYETPAGNDATFSRGYIEE